MTQQPKQWYNSKTIRANTIALVIAIVGIFITSGTDVGLSPELVLVLSGIVVPIFNIILRFVTNEPITFKSVPE